MRRYDITAKMYDERYGEEQTRKYHCVLQQVDVEAKLVLDVGCGSGLFFSHLSAAELVVGVDISHGLLIKAQQHARRSKNVYVVQADADNLPFINNFFGAVLAFTLLQNMPKPQATLCELKRVIRLDGRIAVTGLKKAFLLDEFMNILENRGLELASFVDNQTINCYVAVLNPLNI